ncbi:MAG: ABC transporter permease [Clostridia bacterium]|nr:ABC transporter permease [Clostridia bacterium]
MTLNLISLIKALPGSVAQGILYGIMALGVYVTYKLLDFADLTVDGSLVTGGAVAVMLMLGGVNPYVALLCALLAGMLAGLVTGLLHTAFGIPPILAGILTQIGLYSINMRIMGKSNQPISVDKFDLIVSLREVPNAILMGAIFAVVIIAILYWFFGTEIGGAIRATGTNPQMARAQGVNTNTMKLVALVISNGLVALAGALYAQYNGSADINMGRGAIVIGLAAVIIGEVLFGRKGNFAWTLLSVVFGGIVYFVVIAVVIQMGLSTTDLKLFQALTVAVFLAIPHLRESLAHTLRRSAKGGDR